MPHPPLDWVCKFLYLLVFPQLSECTESVHNPDCTVSVHKSLGDTLAAFQREKQSKYLFYRYLMNNKTNKIFKFGTYFWRVQIHTYMFLSRPLGCHLVYLICFRKRWRVNRVQNFSKPHLELRNRVREEKWNFKSLSLCSEMGQRGLPGPSSAII